MSAVGSWLRPVVPVLYFCYFSFNDTAPTETYTLSLHDALPICQVWRDLVRYEEYRRRRAHQGQRIGHARANRSEEHTSELQSHSDLVCRLLLEKKKKRKLQSYDTTTACRGGRVRGGSPLKSGTL